MIVSAHDGYPRWVTSGADYVEVDVRRTARGVFILSHDEPKQGATPAVLDEALAAARGRVGVQLDLKEPGYELDLLARVEADNVVITTPDRESIARIKRQRPDIRVGQTMQRADRTDADFIALDHTYATEEALELCERYGISLWLWTVDHRELLERFMHDPRVAGVITNRPDLALKLRKARP